MRHDEKFPLGEERIFEFLKKAWIEGWFDLYPDNHFIIRAIEKKLEGFVGKEQFVNNNINLYGVVLKNGKIDYPVLCINFCTNFSMCMQKFMDVFGEKDTKNFIKGQMSARNGKNGYDEDSFFEALSEVSVLRFYLIRKKWEKIIYEPPVNKGVSNSNPEARLKGFVNCKINNLENKYELTVNIEVKSPRFPHESNQSEKVVLPCVLLTEDGREKLKAYCEKEKIKYLDPRAQKLKQFLNSAAKKFSIPNNNEYNILYINWSYRDFPLNGFLEAWSLLTNGINGLLANPKIGMKFGINKEVYERITAVVVYSESLEGLMFGDFRNIWQNNGAGPRFRMWVQDEKVREAEIKDNSNSLFQLTGMNHNFYEGTTAMMNGFVNQKEIIQIINDGTLR